MIGYTIIVGKVLQHKCQIMLFSLNFHTFAFDSQQPIQIFVINVNVRLSCKNLYIVWGFSF